VTLLRILFLVICLFKLRHKKAAILSDRGF
jgi:hypothetical protein